MESLESKLPGTLWATPGLLRDCSTLPAAQGTEEHLGLLASNAACIRKVTGSNLYPDNNYPAISYCSPPGVCSPFFLDLLRSCQLLKKGSAPWTERFYFQFLRISTLAIIPTFHYTYVNCAIFMKVTNVNFHGNPSIESRFNICGQTDRQTDVTKLIGALHDYANAPSASTEQINQCSWKYTCSDRFLEGKMQST